MKVFLLLAFLASADPDPLAVFDAMAADTGGSAARAEIRSRLGDSHPFLRKGAIRFLARRGDTEGLAQGRRLLQDPVPQVRAEAVRALSPLGESENTGVLPLLGDPDGEVRSEAAYHLARRGDAGIQALLDEVFRNDPFYRVRGIIARGWGESGRTEKIDLLLAGHPDANDYIRFHVREALLRLEVPAERLDEIEARAAPRAWRLDLPALLLLLYLLAEIAVARLRRRPIPKVRAGVAFALLCVTLLLAQARREPAPDDFEDLRGASFVVVPLGEAPAEIDLVGDVLRQVTGLDYAVAPSHPLPSEAFRPDRDQYNANEIQRRIRISADSPDGDTPGRLVFVTNADIYPSPYRYTTAYSPSPGGVVLLSLRRLRPISSEGEEVPGLLRARLRKVLIHEIGHNRGLLHEGHEGGCVMNPRDLFETDAGGESFCAPCRKRLDESAGGSILPR